MTANESGPKPQPSLGGRCMVGLSAGAASVFFLLWIGVVQHPSPGSFLRQLLLPEDFVTSFVNGTSSSSFYDLASLQKPTNDKLRKSNLLPFEKEASLPHLRRGHRVAVLRNDKDEGHLLLAHKTDKASTLQRQQEETAANQIARQLQHERLPYEKRRTESLAEALDETRVASSSSSLLESSPAERIVGGFDVIPGEYPWYARLVTSSQRFVCGATVIDRRFVLTAAHCVTIFNSTALKPHLWGFHIGYYCEGCPTRGPEYQVPARRWLIHPFYNPRKSWLHDVALVELVRDIDSLVGGEYAVPDDGTLYASLTRREGTLPLKALGMGFLDDSYTRPTTLQEVDMDYVPWRQCEEEWGWPFRSWGDIVLCAVVRRPPPPPTNNVFSSSTPINEDNATATTTPPPPQPLSPYYGGICLGDSGGPVVSFMPDTGKPVLVGIPSGISNTCVDKVEPDIAARVSVAFPWIRRVVCRQETGLPYWCTQDGGVTGTNSHILAFPASAGSCYERPRFPFREAPGTGQHPCRWLYRRRRDQVVRRICDNLASDAAYQCPITCGTCNGTIVGWNGTIQQGDNDQQQEEFGDGEEDSLLDDTDFGASLDFGDGTGDYFEEEYTWDDSSDVALP